jgi:hypothetical protein
MMNA